MSATGRRRRRVRAASTPEERTGNRASTVSSTAKSRRQVVAAKGVLEGSARAQFFFLTIPSGSGSRAALLGVRSLFTPSSEEAAESFPTNPYDVYVRRRACRARWAEHSLPLAPRLFSFPFFSTTPSLFMSIFPGKLRGNRQILGSVL